jgi:hypothetical protein
VHHRQTRVDGKDARCSILALHDGSELAGVTARAERDAADPVGDAEVVLDVEDQMLQKVGDVDAVLHGHDRPGRFVVIGRLRSAQAPTTAPVG